MKLNSIVYDIETLQTALTEKLVSESPVFQSMYPSDTSKAFVDVLAGYGAMLQYSLVSAMANMYTDTVYSETGIYQLAETLGNRLHGNVSSQITVFVTRTTPSLQGVVGVTIPAHSVWDADGIKFYNPSSITFYNDNTKEVTLVQGEYKTYKTVTNGNAEERVYFSKDFKCNLETVKVFINGEEWSTAETFLPLNANNLIDNTEMQSVVLRTDPDGRTFIKFGNNSTGLLPKSGSSVEIQFVENDGSEGNITSNSINIQLITPIYYYHNGNSVLVEVECENITVAAGGYNNQSLKVLKETSPYVFASGNRAISKEDYKAMLINKCGYITANVWGEYEESIYNGYYDKSMMNTVYYTGIKQLQHYDHKPLGAINNLKYSGNDLLNNPYTFSGNVGTIKGFPGSYSIEFDYSLDAKIKMKYRDRFGTGILTCDPSINNNNISLYPFNDIGVSLINENNPRVTISSGIHFWDYEGKDKAYIEQNRIDKNVPDSILKELGGSYDSPDKQWTGDIKTIFEYNTIEGYPQEVGNSNHVFTFIWDGFNKDERSKNLEFSNPIKIYFEFDTNCKTPIAALAFRSPKEPGLLKYCPGKFALFATDQASDKAPISNVRNNAYWKKVIDVNKIEFNLNGTDNDWSDWYTTNLYQPNKSVSDADINNGYTVLYDNWQSYKRYVLEIYSFQDEILSTFGQFMLIPGIKMLYANNNLDYYAWIYSLPENMINYQHDWEPEVVYLTSASIMPTRAEQPLVKTDGDEYPSKYFYNPSDTNKNTRYSYETATFDNTLERIITTLCKQSKSITLASGYPSYTGTSITGVTVSNPNKFKQATGLAQRTVEDTYTYIFTYQSDSTGNYWILNNGIKINNITNDYGISVSGTPANNDTITVKYVLTWGSRTVDIADKSERYYRVSTTGENLNIHKINGVSTINYENNDEINLSIPAFPKDMKYYTYTVNVIGAGASNGYKTGERLYAEVPMTDGTGYSYFHVVIQNANTGDGAGKCVVFYSKSPNDTVSNLPLADNTQINDEYELVPKTPGGTEGSGAKIVISSTAAINMYSNMTGNSYTLSQTQRLDEPVMETYNHFTTYMEFKQPRIKQVNISLNVEYEENINTSEVEINIRKALADVFEITPYFLGQNIPINKIWKAVQGVPGVVRFSITYPQEDIKCELNELLILNDSDIVINPILPAKYR